MHSQPGWKDDYLQVISRLMAEGDTIDAIADQLDIARFGRRPPRASARAGPAVLGGAIGSAWARVGRVRIHQHHLIRNHQMQSPSGRWPVPPKYLLRRPDGRWRSMESAVEEFILTAPMVASATISRTPAAYCRPSSTSSRINSSPAARSSATRAAPRRCSQARTTIASGAARRPERDRAALARWRLVSAASPSTRGGG